MRPASASPNAVALLAGYGAVWRKDMFNAKELEDEGLDMDKVARCCEQAIQSLCEDDSFESLFVVGVLAHMRDGCEEHRGIN